MWLIRLYLPVGIAQAAIVAFAHVADEELKVKFEEAGSARVSSFFL